MTVNGEGTGRGEQIAAWNDNEGGDDIDPHPGPGVPRAAKYQDVPVYEYEDVVIERDRYREALKAIERMAGAAGSGEVPAMPIAELARWALK